MSSLVIVGAQWGDEGKGKIVDALAEKANVVIRFQGGDNAGHTVYCGEKKYVFHILPSGMLRENVLNIIGGGVVLNPYRLRDELNEINISEKALSEKLRISADCHLILPCHIAQDKAAEIARGNTKIGTTQRGIGPAYADRAARTGIRAGDLLDESCFFKQLDILLKSKQAILPPEAREEVCNTEKTGREILAIMKPYLPLIADTGEIIYQMHRQGKSILFEGAQGTMLDIISGTYPYVTSSHTIAGGAAVGAGVGPHLIDRIWGVSKAYTTRVGEGPFPSELKDASGDKIRELGGEYGATTKRPRRCGWLDIMQLKKAVRLNTLDGLILTKLDVLDNFEQIGVCVAYKLNGRLLSSAPINTEDLNKVEPVIEFMPGWKKPTAGCRVFKELPSETRKYVKAIEDWLEVPVVMMSAGKDRYDLIVRKQAFDQKR
jgi:adenylosuccinate synthase